MKFETIDTTKLLSLGILLNVFCSIFFIAQAEKLYTNRFVVQLDPLANPTAVANSLNLENKAQIGNFFLFVGHHLSKRSLNKHDTTIFDDHEHIQWYQQQHILKRVKRDLELPFHQTSQSNTTSSLFRDPLYEKQWYFNKGGKGSFDMNIKAVWAMNITGVGVVITILDDGVQADHPDLVKNYDKLASIDINGDDDNPTPQDNGENKHGTRCAGEIAATADNEYCGVGVAYNSRIGGVRMLDGTVTDDVEAQALRFNNQYIDIYSASWGPDDNGKTVDGPGRNAKLAFEEGVKYGRRGLGSIFVWASGNGGKKGDDCNCDGYTNSIYTLSISSANQRGLKPWYLEECSSTLATTYSSGTPTRDGNIVTSDQTTEMEEAIRNGRKPDPNKFCTLVHTGTSASAPIAAGIIALALEANKNLSWRDMQHLAVLTSRKQPLYEENGWFKNGVGRFFNHKFGYGLMDAEAMVKLAMNWISVPQQRKCETAIDRTERLIKGEIEVTMNVTDCSDTENIVNYLEHVQVVISLRYMPRGSLRIIVVSPSRTQSTLLRPRDADTDEDTFDNWPLMSVHFWGEKPQGVWKLIIRAEDRRHVGRKRPRPSSVNNENTGVLYSWSLVFHGTKELPHVHYPIHTKLPGRSYQVTKLNLSMFEDRTEALYSAQDTAFIPLAIVISIFVITVLLCAVLASFVRSAGRFAGDVELRLKSWKLNSSRNTTYSKLSCVNPDP